MYASVCSCLQVIADGVSLCTVLPTPGHEAAAKMCFISRAEALVPPDPVVLSQLLSIKPKDEQGLVPAMISPVQTSYLACVLSCVDPQQLRLAPDHSVSFGGTNCGLVPAVIINNALLRQARDDYVQMLVVSMFDSWLLAHSCSISGS